MEVARGESEVLRKMRRHHTLDRLRLIGGRRRGNMVIQGRKVKFVVEVAAVVNLIRVQMCDLLFAFLHGMSADQVRMRHSETLKMLDVLYELFDDLQVLEEWGYSEDQRIWLKDRLGYVIGANRSLQVATYHTGGPDATGCFAGR